MIIYRETETLAADLGFSIRSLYSLTNDIDRHYRLVKIEKRSGYRQLCIPDDFLKAVQRRINRQILSHMGVSEYASAYHAGASIQKNAAVHCGKNKVFRLDIAHCFDSVMYSQVKSVFPAEVFSEANRVLLAMLCYYKDSLPQGAPTSPAILNLIFRSFDEKIGSFCRKRGIDYTRYCDDMVFSGDFDTREVYGVVKHELGEMGFFLNTQKSHTAGRGACQTVTGLVVNEKVHLPAEYRRRLRQEIYYCRRFGVRSQMERSGAADMEKYLQSLLGRINYAISSGCGEFADARAWVMEQPVK